MHHRPHDARLMYGASDTDANMLWATRFFAPDPFTFIERGGKKYVVMTDLEIDRAKRQATVDAVLPYTDYVRKLQAGGTPFPSSSQVIAEVLHSLNVKRVAVPVSFPLGLADQLRADAFVVEVHSDPFWPDREIKTDEEA